MAKLSDMSFLQAVIFWAMVGKMLLFFAEIEKARGEIKVDTVHFETLDGFQPINRRAMEMVMKQL